MTQAINVINQLYIDYDDRKLLRDGNLKPQKKSLAQKYSQVIAVSGLRYPKYNCLSSNLECFHDFLPGFALPASF